MKEKNYQIYIFFCCYVDDKKMDLRNFILKRKVYAENKI